MYLSILHEPGLPGLVLTPSVVIVRLCTLEVFSDCSQCCTGQWNEIRGKSGCVEH